MLEFTKQGFQQLNAQVDKAIKKSPQPEQQIEAIAYAYLKFAFNNKEYYQLMYGLGMPTCETVRQIEELHSFTELILGPIRNLIAESKNSKADPFLKLHTYWSMLHGLISINMLGEGFNKDEMNEMILKDFISGFISGIKK